MFEVPNEKMVKAVCNVVRLYLCNANNRDDLQVVSSAFEVSVLADSYPRITLEMTVVPSRSGTRTPTPAYTPACEAFLKEVEAGALSPKTFEEGLAYLESHILK